MFFGINGAEALLIVLIAIVVIGPERMPQYARQLRAWAEQGREWITKGKATVKAELGDEVDLSQFDPRQYDPRRIVREALAQPAPRPVPPAGAAAAAGASAKAAASGATPGVTNPAQPASFDDEAT